MLGVLKRRLKPKRTTNVQRLPCDGPNVESRLGPSVRQIHPLCDEKAHLLCYEKIDDVKENETNISPPPYPKRASLDSTTTTTPPSIGIPTPSPTTPLYPLTPNICVEAGRIQFIRQESDAATDCLPTPPTTPRPLGRVTVTRGQQTDDEGETLFADIKKLLEHRIIELRSALEEAQKNEAKDKATIGRLQKQLARRESAQRDAERERRLRIDSETRTKQALQEAARCRSRLKILTNEFSRMEETVRSMLVYKKQLEQLRQEKNALTLAFENRCQQYQSTIVRLNNEITCLREELERRASKNDDSSNCIFDAHTNALQRYAEETRKQYERCLDDVANQVVKALLTQKGLREEVVALNGRIRDLEAQNKALTSMLMHHLRRDGNEEASIEDGLLDARLSFEDKKRHRILTRLWTELRGGEVSPNGLIEALNAVDWTPSPQRPVSLNLHLPLIPKYRKNKPFVVPKNDEESESPESGNRDEGYSTMSSDVQGELARNEVTTARGLEDLKEASDENGLNLLADGKDPDILYIPLNLLNLKARNSYPPCKTMLPFQHIMRSFSDSHLCIKITTAPTPCYTFSSPISSSPSIFLVDFERNPLRRVRASNALYETTTDTYEESAGECYAPAWDAEYVQHWLRLDETRSALQQQQQLLELEYDRAELEDWSLSLSTEDLQWKRLDSMNVVGTPVSLVLPSIQEHNTLELEEDANELLWNSSSYLADKEGRELVTLLMDATPKSDERPSWPYASNDQQISPDNSWSSTDDRGGDGSKRSSAALSGCSDDTGELPVTDFTRDFYRLVKFESTKSLASTSSRSLVGGVSSDNVGGDNVLHNVLSLIAEKSTSDDPSTIETIDVIVQSDLVDEVVETRENLQKIAYADEVCLVTAYDSFISENCSEITERPVDICTTIVDGDETDTIISSTPPPPPPSTQSRIPLPQKKVKSKLPKSRIPQQRNRQSKQTSEKVSDGMVGNGIIDGPPHRAVSFHERATSKDIIDELNRMIKNGEETTECGDDSKLDQDCQVTGWVHIERDIDLADPKARANLLDVMMASVSSDSSPTSSCGGSVASDSQEDPPNYGHLHRLHRFHRQKKAYAVRPELAVVRVHPPSSALRPSIIGRQDFYVRYGEKEREAVASFDFLDEFSTSTMTTSYSSNEEMTIRRDDETTPF